MCFVFDPWGVKTFLDLNIIKGRPKSPFDKTSSRIEVCSLAMANCVSVVFALGLFNNVQ